MLRFKHILFPVDFSDQCVKVAPFVEAWATQFGARVTLLNVLEMPTAYYADLSDFLGSLDIESILEHRRNRLDCFVPASFRKADDRRVVEAGVAAMSILDFVRGEGVDLLMMPTHGYGPFRRFLLGSVTAKVLHDSHCPVWTSIHAEQPPSILSTPDCRRILCAVDLTSKSVELIGWAKQFAGSFGAKLQVVHVVTGWPGETLIPEADQFRKMIFDFAGKEIEKFQQQAGSKAEVQLRSGEIAPVVHRAALDFNADLVVIGRGVLQAPLGRLRTHAYSIIRESPCPVLSV